MFTDVRPAGHEPGSHCSLGEAGPSPDPLSQDFWEESLGPLFEVRLRMGAKVFRAFHTSLAIEMVVSGFGGTRDCASGEGKGGRELNKSNDVVICSFWKSSHLRHSQNQVVTPKMVSQEASEL